MNGYPFDVPIICIDDTVKLFDLSILPEASVSATTTPEMKFKDPFLAKFIDWCMHVIDHKLAHLVFVSFPWETY